MKNNILKTLLLILAVSYSVSTFAVLKETDLHKTLTILRLELENNIKNQEKKMVEYKARNEKQHEQLKEYYKNIQQIGLILYSQKTDFTFDIAYACQEATNLYREISKTTIPYDTIKGRVMAEIAKYDSLILSLKSLPPAIKETSSIDSLTAEDSLVYNIDVDSTESKQIINATNLQKQSSGSKLFQLTEKEQRDRDSCLVYAMKLRDNLQIILSELEEDSYHYTIIINKVKRMNSYAQLYYKNLQASIFSNSGDNYFKILTNLPRQISKAKDDISDKYKPLTNSKRKDMRSEWRGPTVLFLSIFMLFYIAIATILSNFILRAIPYITKHLFPSFSHKFSNRFKHIISEEDYKKKRFAIILALGVLLFAIAISIVQSVIIRKNIMIMATDLMIQFAWLIEVILISLLIRLNGSQIKQGINIHMPFLWLALTVIFFRILLLPNSIITILCPPILLGFTIWQIISIRRNRSLPFSDLICSGFSLVVIISSCLFAWKGSTLLAVQIIIWWTFQLACIETIFCVFDVMRSYEDNVIIRSVMYIDGDISATKKMILANRMGLLTKKMQKGKYVHKTFLYDIITKLAIPAGAIISIPLSIYWAASVFEMQTAFEQNFKENLIILPDNNAKFTLMTLCFVIVNFFTFRLANYLIGSYYSIIRIKHQDEFKSTHNATLAKNVIGIIIWFVYILTTLIVLQVPKTGISVAMAGLATGMGFAMKDVLENFFYGMSLMSGRLRVGDYIECDGIRGQVESITYQSTQIITADGSVMAFLNTSLFSKNFKNLTRNHNYEFLTIPIGVAYGSNIKEVRNIIINSLNKLRRKTADGRNMIDPLKDIEVRVNNFGDNSVDLSVIIWALVDQKGKFTSDAKEAIYDALNANNIEIPYPQRDIYIKNFEKN